MVPLILETDPKVARLEIRGVSNKNQRFGDQRGRQVHERLEHSQISSNYFTLSPHITAHETTIHQVIFLLLIKRIETISISRLASVSLYFNEDVYLNTGFAFLPKPNVLAHVHKISV